MRFSKILIKNIIPESPDNIYEVLNIKSSSDTRASTVINGRGNLDGYIEMNQGSLTAATN